MDVKLNNIAIPSYLDGNNATCNFWRSAENLAVIILGMNKERLASIVILPDQNILTGQ